MQRDNLGDALACGRSFYGLDAVSEHVQYMCETIVNTWISKQHLMRERFGEEIA